MKMTLDELKGKIEEMSEDELAVALYENTAPLDLERKVQTPAESVGMTDRKHITLNEEGTFTDTCTDAQKKKILGVFAATIELRNDIYNEEETFNRAPKYEQLKEFYECFLEMTCHMQLEGERGLLVTAPTKEERDIRDEEFRLLSEQYEELTGEPLDPDEVFDRAAALVNKPPTP